ncbi:hypothetical protein [Paenibacillus polymyxa]|uniref:hypothetical protein n=1 Tax=Paenibacillus polymyxa TaxID=1406 RepID=UPI00234A584B|nr:hypothetical protein [Paenibacillus polymyxa]WCM61384.1 hypothetical protein OYT09_26220 [Paenibacillus polymyxa]
MLSWDEVLNQYKAVIKRVTEESSQSFFKRGIEDVYQFGMLSVYDYWIDGNYRTIKEIQNHTMLFLQSEMKPAYSS